MQAIRLVNTTDITDKEWLEWRRRGITGSDIGAICGINKWSSPVSVYMDKLGELPEQEDNEAMYFGRILEDVVAKEFSFRTGFRVERRNAILQHLEHEWALANIDRLIIDREKGHGILEVKTTSEYLKDQWTDDEVPASYLTQIQWYLFVTGLQWGYFATLIGGNKFIMKYVERDDELIQYLFDIGKEFWEEHVLKKAPPAFDGSDASTKLLSELYPKSEDGSQTELPDEANALITAIEQLKQDEKDLETTRKEYENKLKSMLGDFESGVIGDREVTWRSYETTRFDSKSFRKDHEDLFEKYRKTTLARRLLIK
ncbi:hypothetical protein BEP19_15000 [Ammoniphilus oxalaticus]|uniref:YqaJ viral recombinase domain-containing protein n=1 Tax=Ammoniphilus oxalaticus TaxID=66863 RepID=A0A419SCY5_9BACL|nr:YqaJ viral recombinase family protein [Ammoniphilus oxalaticus]RKD20989.1 hypothetical protein BEP19_15000 [Ammoniphilus oxalaticus]